MFHLFALLVSLSGFLALLLCAVLAAYCEMIQAMEDDNETPRSKL